MQKISLAVLGIFIGILSAFAQKTPQDSNYVDRRLKVEEVNLVTSYYTQNGNNSAVMGGIGTEKLSDFSNTLDLRLSKWSKTNQQHSLTLEMGYDSYSSASSDNIDYNTISSPSYNDQRYYPSVAWSVLDPAKGTTTGANLSYSTEWDYQSYGGGLNFAKTSADKSSEFSVKAGAFFDEWTMILPVEVRPENYPSGSERTLPNVPRSPRNSFNLALAWAKIINPRLQLAFVIEPSYQQGQLATPYQRVFFTDQTVTNEKLPSQRWKLPLGVRASYFAGDRVVLRGFYRFYADQWGLIGNSLSLESAIKITPKLSVSPYYRFYAQNAVKYFAPYEKHSSATDFYTSDYDLSTLNSHSFGTGVRWVCDKAIFGIPRLKNWRKGQEKSVGDKAFFGIQPIIELRYGHYIRNTALTSNIVSLHLKVKF